MFDDGAPPPSTGKPQNGGRRWDAAVWILLPLGETVRRWGHWDTWIFWIDDFIIGALLLFGAWAVRRRKEHGLRILAAGWGVAFGMLLSCIWRYGSAEAADRSSEDLVRQLLHSSNWSAGL